MSNKFKAYISYSHRDERWAVWLHRALESYRLPRKLIGTETSVGKVPARLKPVFRDRDDLSSDSDLAGTVKQALTNSENLIVVCSPESAASVWVNEEIRFFAGLGREKKIFCIIVDGDPAATDVEFACFPAALAEVGLQEPLAADVRKWADGKRLSRLKLIAGMLGLPLDQLRRRDLQKRQRTWALVALAAIVMLTVLVTAITSRIAAEQRRVSGESLVSYKLTELRTMLNVADDPEELARLRQWDKQELEDLLASAGDGEDALLNAAMDLREQGNDLYGNEKLPESLEKLQQSWALLAVAYQRDRSNKDMLFELGQAEFYIGQVYMDQGKLKEAEKAFFAYAEITRRLIVSEPQNAEWVLEMAYALTNLAVLEDMKDEGDPERTLQLTQSALEYNQIALVLDPQNTYYKSELGQSHAFLADAQRGVCDLEGALLSRQKNVSLERDMLAMDSSNPGKVRRLAYALSGYTSVQIEMGRTADAINSSEEALRLIDPLVQEYPDNRQLKRFVLLRTHRLAIQKALSGEIEQAAKTMEALEKDWQLYFQDAAEDDLGAIEDYTAYLIDNAWLVRQTGDSVLAGQLLEKSKANSIETLKRLPGNRNAGNLLMLATYRLWDIRQEMPSDSILTMLPYYYSNSGSIRACHDASMAARKAIMLGATTRAAELTAYLVGNGYREAFFVRACKKHSLCMDIDE